MPTSARPIDQIRALQKRVAKWRQQQGGPGRWIPDWSWEEAATMAGVAGVDTTARALRLALNASEKAPVPSS